MADLAAQQFRNLAPEGWALLPILEEVDSTNLELLRRLTVGSARPGLVLLARRQTAGRGRHGRSWSAPTDHGLLMSIALGCEVKAAGVLTALGAVAVRAALAEWKVPSSIDWPNDVLVRGRKVAGVLCEGRSDLSAVVLGIGVNLRQSAADFPAALRRPSTSLRLEGVDTSSHQFAEAVLRQMEQRCRVLATRGAEDLADELFRATGLQETAVRAGRVGSVGEGVWTQLDPGFVLHLRSEDGTTQCLEGAHVEFVVPASDPSAGTGTATFGRSSPSRSP